MSNQSIREFSFPTGQIFQIIQGDITQQKVDGIVNAANSQLRHGGGVAGIIVHRGGGDIQVASDDWVRKFGPVSHAEPAYTLADELKLESLALPAISTGIFGFPKKRAARIIVQAIQHYFKNNNDSSMELVKLVLYDQPTLDVFIETWDAGMGETDC